MLLHCRAHSNIPRPGFLLVWNDACLIHNDQAALLSSRELPRSIEQPDVAIFLGRFNGKFLFAVEADGESPPAAPEGREFSGLRALSHHYPRHTPRCWPTPRPWSAGNAPTAIAAIAAAPAAQRKRIPSCPARRAGAGNEYSPASTRPSSCWRTATIDACWAARRAGRTGDLYDRRFRRTRREPGRRSPPGKCERKPIFVSAVATTWDLSRGRFRLR